MWLCLNCLWPYHYFINKIIIMSNHFNHFLRKDDTIYLSTISKQGINSKEPYNRQSTFLKNDISGTNPRNMVPQSLSGNFSLSTHIEPYPDRYQLINKRSDSLFIGDIEGATPKSSLFRTNRVVNPLSPVYTLPSVSQIIADKGRNFIRDTLKVDDINCKRKHFWENKRERMITQPVEGVKPLRHFKQIKKISRLQVKDINKGDAFESRRQPNPLSPLYFWRDNLQKRLNNSYGTIQGSYPHKKESSQTNKPNLCLSIKDIQGTQANSFSAKAHFIDKRRQFRNYMTIKDIEKADASSLQKGILTKRQTNPLMPNYELPGHLQLH